MPNPSALAPPLPLIIPPSLAPGVPHLFSLLFFSIRICSSLLNMSLDEGVVGILRLGGTGVNPLRLLVGVFDMVFCFDSWNFQVIYSPLAWVTSSRGQTTLQCHHETCSIKACKTSTSIKVVKSKKSLQIISQIFRNGSTSTCFLYIKCIQRKFEKEKTASSENGRISLNLIKIRNQEWIATKQGKK
ncbi:hypothetical protein JTE90_005076 [Oedothorax gibbosus]|uniref:Uncharacterized protein n=1 Tax=Oedothorax gibbosus TaxID=931172 RepID=A0AAV6VCZ3_9ARAC|nr:hypothetical protein JTE90_005076 [Oedothorax gibbosus]